MAKARDDIQSLAVILFIWAITTILLKTIFSKLRNKSRVPPGPIGLPIIGHLHLTGKFPHQTFDRLSKRYGPVFRVDLGRIPCIIVSSVETVEYLLKTQETLVNSRRFPGPVRHINHGAFDLAFAPYSPYSKLLKKLCMTEMLGARMLEHLLPVRKDEIQRLLKIVLKKAQVGEPVHLRSEVMTMINNVLSRMMAGRTCIKGPYADLPLLVRESVEITGIFDLSDFISIVAFFESLDLQGLKRRSENLRKRFSVLMDKLIEEKEVEMKKSGEASKDLLCALIEKTKEENSEIKVTRDDIKAFVLGILLAGTDTTDTTIEWALAEILNSPRVLQKARDEIESVVGRDRVVTESDASKLPYIHAIIKETFRLHPAHPIIFREFNEDCNVEGYDITRGSQMFINMWSIGRQPTYWEKPLEFRPERFMPLEGDKSWIDVKGRHFLLLPFGSGRRACPGADLALNLVYVTIALMIQCFDWKIGNGKQDEVLDLSEGRGLVLPLEKPLVAVPKVRLNPFPSMD